jgi:plastocyanin
MRMAWWATVVVLAVVAAGCGGRGAQDQQAPPAANVIRIIGKDNLYEPKTIEIKAGQEYEFVFKNDGTSVHNAIIKSKDAVGEDFQTDVVVDAGQESKFRVKIDKAGTYAMDCTYHPEMKGEVKVAP